MNFSDNDRIKMLDEKIQPVLDIIEFEEKTNDLKKLDNLEMASFFVMVGGFAASIGAFFYSMSDANTRGFDYAMGTFMSLMLGFLFSMLFILIHDHFNHVLFNYLPFTRKIYQKGRSALNFWANKLEDINVQFPLIFHIEKNFNIGATSTTSYEYLKKLKNSCKNKKYFDAARAFYACSKTVADIKEKYSSNSYQQNYDYNYSKYLSENERTLGFISDNKNEDIEENEKVVGGLDIKKQL